MRLRALAAAAAWVALTMVAPARAQDAPSVWGAVIHASMVPVPADPLLDRYGPMLKRLFGFTQFECLGSAWGTGRASEESWVSPTSEFFLQTTPASDAHRPGILLDVVLWQRGEALLETRVRMAVGKPLVIRVCDYRDGALLVLLDLRD